MDSKDLLIDWLRIIIIGLMGRDNMKDTEMKKP